jgi:hypothetical protein
LDEWIDPFTLLHPSSFTLHTTPSLMVPFGSIWFIFQTDPFHFSISFNFSDSIHETTNTCMKPVWKTILTKSKLVLFCLVPSATRLNIIQSRPIFLTKLRQNHRKMFISCENSYLLGGVPFDVRTVFLSCQKMFIVSSFMFDSTSFVVHLNLFDWVSKHENQHINLFIKNHVTGLSFDLSPNQRVSWR